MLDFTVSDSVISTVYIVVCVAVVVGFWIEFLVWYQATHQEPVEPLSAKELTAVMHRLPEREQYTKNLYLRDVGHESFSDIAHDMTPRGLLQYYIRKTHESIAAGDERAAATRIRMAASLAFQLYPDLRPPITFSQEARPLPPVVVFFPTRPVVH